MWNEKKIKSRIKGLTVRNGSYFLRTSINGERVQLTLGREDRLTIKDAERLTIETIEKIETIGLEAYKALGRTRKVHGIGHNSMTVSDVLEEFMEHGKEHGTKKTGGRPLRERSLEFYRRHKENRWKDYLQLPIASITTEHIEEWYSKWLRMKDQYGNKTTTSADDALRLLSRIFNWAVSKRYIPFNPCTAITQGEGRVLPVKRKKDKDRRINMQTGELGRFLVSLITYKPLQN